MTEAAVAMDSLRRIVRGLRTMHAAARGRNLTAAQLFVLRQIARHPGLSLTDLSRRTATSASSVSEVVARLMQCGFVHRSVDPIDRRRASFELTTSGASALTNAPKTVQEQLVEGFASMSADDQRALARTLNLWVQVSSLDALPPTMFFEPAE